MGTKWFTGGVIAAPPAEESNLTSLSMASGTDRPSTALLQRRTSVELESDWRQLRSCANRLFYHG